MDEIRPNIYTHLSYREFLRAWFAWRKVQNRRYSYRLFARKAGLSSAGLFLEIVKEKRNLTERSIEQFLRALDLDAAEARFFRALVALDQSKSRQEREAAWTDIQATKRFREARQLEREAFDYVAHWYYPAIRELAQCSSFRNDPHWVARTLTPSISVREARAALSALLAMGMLVDDGEGGASPSESTVVTPHEVFGLAVYRYHHGMLARASEALDTIPAARRHFGAVTVAIPQHLVSTLKSEIGTFQERVLALADAEATEADSVYQLNLQFFPLSRPPEDT